MPAGETTPVQEDQDCDFVLQIARQGHFADATRLSPR